VRGLSGKEEAEEIKRVPRLSLPQRECRGPSILRVQHPTRHSSGQRHRRAEQFNQGASHSREQWSRGGGVGSSSRVENARAAEAALYDAGETWGKDFRRAYYRP
jgi:hypothetical protein